MVINMVLTTKAGVLEALQGDYGKVFSTVSMVHGNPAYPCLPMVIIMQWFGGDYGYQ